VRNMPPGPAGVLQRHYTDLHAHYRMDRRGRQQLHGLGQDVQDDDTGGLAADELWSWSSRPAAIVLNTPALKGARSRNSHASLHLRSSDTDRSLRALAGPSTRTIGPAPETAQRAPDPPTLDSVLTEGWACCGGYRGGRTEEYPAIKRRTRERTVHPIVLGDLPVQLLSVYSPTSSLATSSTNAPIPLT